jgi:hypothetical protein
MWAGDVGFINIRHVKRLGKFLVAILAMIDVLRHEVPPRDMIAPTAMSRKSVEEFSSSSHEAS